MNVLDTSPSPMNESAGQSITQSMRSNTTSTAVFYTVFLGLAALCIGWVIIKRCIANQLEHHTVRDQNTNSFDRQNANRVEEIVQEIPGVAAVPVQWPPPDLNMQSNNSPVNEPPAVNTQPVAISRFERLKKLFSRSQIVEQTGDQAIELAPPPITQAADQQPPPNVPPPNYVDAVKKFNTLKITIPNNNSTDPNNRPINQFEPSYVHSPTRSPSLIEFDSEYVQPPSYQADNPQSNTLALPSANNQSNIQLADQLVDHEIVSPQHVAIAIPQSND